MSWIDHLKTDERDDLFRHLDGDSPLEDLATLGACMTIIFGMLEREAKEKPADEIEGTTLSDAAIWFSDFSRFCIGRFFSGPGTAPR